MKLQTGALRIIAQADRSTSATELHIMYKLDTLVNRRHKHSCHYAFKAIHDMCPASFCLLFKPVSTRDCPIATRSATNMNIVVPATD